MIVIHNSFLLLLFSHYSMVFFLICEGKKDKLCKKNCFFNLNLLLLICLERRIMKKTLTFIVALVLIISTLGCNKNSNLKNGEDVLVSFSDKSLNITTNDLYEVLKEQMYKHFHLANYPFYNSIKLEFRREYFTKLYNLFEEIKNDQSFEYKYFYKKEIK